MLSDSERQVLEFASVVELVRTEEVAQLLEGAGDDAECRLAALAAAGLLSRERIWPPESPTFRITAAGTNAISSPLAAPGISHRVRHAVGVGGLWLMATRGIFGPADCVLTERQMESADRLDDADSPFATQPGKFGLASGLHYADLMLLTSRGRIAIELLLRTPEPRAFEAILRAYAADSRMNAVLYVVHDPWVGQLVQSAAAWAELSPMVHVQPAVFG